MQDRLATFHGDGPADEPTALPFRSDQVLQLGHHLRARLVPDLELAVGEMDGRSCDLAKVPPALESRRAVTRPERASDGQLANLSRARRIIHVTHWRPLDCPKSRLVTRRSLTAYVLVGAFAFATQGEGELRITCYSSYMVTAADREWDPSAPAPGGLETVRAFANSVDAYRGRDSLSDPETAAASLARIGLWEAEEALSTTHLKLARGFRRSIRSLIVDDPGAPGLGSFGLQLRVEDAISSDIGRYPRIAGDRDQLRAGLAHMTLELYLAGHGGRLVRLKACANPGCQWIFWDASRPGTGRWCSMQLCGAQHKSRAYRRRHQ